MAAEIPRVPRDWPTFGIFAQVVVAFGQGAGHLPVSEAGIRAAAEHYVPRIEEHAKRWPDDAPVVLGLARIMGQLAAARAAANGRPIVDVDDFAYAQRAVHHARDETAALIGRCPWP
jgi:hypothetical protein